MDRLRTNVAVLASCLLLAGCGSATKPEGAGQAPAGHEAAAKVGRCPADAPAVVGARTVTRADLDGDGRAEAVKLTAADGDCPHLLFAKVSGRYVDAQLPVDAPAVSRAYAVEVPGREGDLVVTRQDHPRGGYQLRLFGAGPEGLVELRDGEHPLVPFVALDVQEHPLSVDCTDGGVELTEAVAHEPPGVVFAWDIKRTTYAVHGSEVTPGTPEEIADNVLPRQLEAKYPELVEHRAFESCRAGR
jgi:hypothetical protein